MLPGNRTIEKIVLSGNWFSTKITFYDLWIFTVPYFYSFSRSKYLVFSSKILYFLHLITGFLCPYFWPLKKLNNPYQKMKRTIFGLQNVGSQSLILVYGICQIGRFVTFCHILSIFSYYTGDSYYLVWFWIRTIPGIVLSEFILSGDSLYFPLFVLLVKFFGW